MHANNYKEYVRRVKECVEKSQEDMSDDDDDDEEEGTENQVEEG